MDGDYPRIERPTEKGFYFYRWGAEDWTVIDVRKPRGYGLRGFAIGGATHIPIAHLTGEWAGPIPPPTKKPEPPALTPLASPVPQRRRRPARLRQRTRPLTAEGLEP